MPAVAYARGRYGPIANAAVSVEDRGFQFADSLYEVVAFLNGHLLDWDRHVARLRRGMAELKIGHSPTDRALAAIAARLLRLSRLEDGLLYIQLSRGVAPRDHGFPADTSPTLVMTARRFDFAQRIRQLASGVAVVSGPDQRWARCDLKTTALLPAVLAKQQARAQGAFEALFVTADGTVTEGGSTNAWMVDANGHIRTHPTGPRILPGVARDSLIGLARADGLVVIEEAFTLADARAAPELFLTSTTAPILPVTRLDDAPVGSGMPGSVVARLAALAWAEVSRQTGWSATVAAPLIKR